MARMWIARLQASITLAWLACALAWGAWKREEPAVALAGMAAIALAHGWVLALEFLAQRLVSRTDATPRAPASVLLGAWLSELVAAPRVFCWQQPFGRLRHPDHLLPRHQGRRGVVFVHGYLCNRGLWNPWLARLTREDRPFIALDLSPAFGRIEQGVPQIEAAVARMAGATGLAPLLVGHSMGGLAMRAWLAQSRAPERVHRWVTLGSPHHGTWLAHFGSTPNARQLRPDSAWLQALQKAVPEPWQRHAVCFYSNADNVVFPPGCARLEGADNRLIRGLAHVQMVFAPEVMEAVLALCDAPESLPTAPPG